MTLPAVSDPWHGRAAGESGRTPMTLPGRRRSLARVRAAGESGRTSRAWHACQL